MSKKNKKLKKLTIMDREERIWRELTKNFLNEKQFAVVAATATGIGTAAAAVGATAVGVAGTLMGADAQQSLAVGGMVAAGMSVAAHLNTHGVILDKVAKGKIVADNQEKALLAIGAAASVLSGGLGAGITAGTQKLTTSVINHLQPNHQIEQTVAVELMPVIDEIVIEK